MISFSCLYICRNIPKRHNFQATHNGSNTRFESFLQDMAKQKHVSGVALMMQNGRIIHAKGLEPMGMGYSRIHVAAHVPAPNEASGFRQSEKRAMYVADDTETLPATAPDAGLITTLDW